VSFTEDVSKRFEAYGWHVQHVDDVNNISTLETAVKNAQAASDKPSIIVTKTHIGYGSPNKQDTSGSHGSPLGEAEVKLSKKNLGWPEEPTFYVPEEVTKHFSTIIANGKEEENKWNLLFIEYREKYPDEAKLFIDMMNGDLGDEWK
jgi:transketolase